jgi:hypothetical protein
LAWGAAAGRFLQNPLPAPHPPPPPRPPSCATGSGLQPMRMELASRLWAAGIKAEFGFKPNPKMADQLGYALKAGIPFLVLFGEDEVAQVGARMCVCVCVRVCCKGGALCALGRWILPGHPWGLVWSSHVRCEPESCAALHAAFRALCCPHGPEPFAVQRCAGCRAW